LAIDDEANSFLRNASYLCCLNLTSAVSHKIDRSFDLRRYISSPGVIAAMEIVVRGDSDCGDEKGAPKSALRLGKEKAEAARLGLVLLSVSS
jgi:hypothetical protein